MEPRPNELNTMQPNPESLPRRPEGRRRSRFSIEPLEERIAPHKGGIGGSAGGSDPSLGF